MTDTEFDNELKQYLSDLFVADKSVAGAEFYLNIQPGLISFGGHFLLTDNETVPIHIRQKNRSSNADFADKVESYHKQSTNKGLNKWNKAFFKIKSNGQVIREFIWDEVWEQEEINSYHGQTELARQKWYWDEK